MSKNRTIKIVKPFEIKEDKSKLGYADEIILNDALHRVNTSLRMIDGRELAIDYYNRLQQYVAEFERKWGLGDK